MVASCDRTLPEKKTRKAFSEDDVLKFLRRLREHGFGEIVLQVANHDVVRIKKQETHEPSDVN